jgi:exodeoxyribonuclease V alpha subunit
MTTYQAIKSSVFSNFDLHFARFICRISEIEDDALFLACALANKGLRNGNICIDLTEFSDTLFEISTDKKKQSPSLDTWTDILKKCNAIGNPGGYKPLILDSSRLYIYRNWQYEQQLAVSIKERLNDKIPPNNILKEYLSILFSSSDNEINWQQVAACVSLLNRFTVISGGPGTGKTTTVAKILALLQLSSQENLRIALTAPTGKAAARLNSSISSIIPTLPVPDEFRNIIPKETSTIHRLLGPIPDSPYFFHNKSNPLPFDIVIVDEASMIDLALMTKLVSAIPQKSRLILLGDRDQLSSVEAGAILGDICSTNQKNTFRCEQCESLNKMIPGYSIHGDDLEPPIADSIVTLRKSYRFDDSSGIGILSRAVNQGNPDKALAVLTDNRVDCIWNQLPGEHLLRQSLQKITKKYFVSLSQEREPHLALALLDRFKILCASRHGFYGVENINRLIIATLSSMGMIPPEKSIFNGQPIIINSNDYSLDLYNGDTGVITWVPGANSNLKAIFSGPDQTLRSFHPRKLHSWESAYALTVHKSQGSEFDHILLILPPVYNPVLTRELLYTAITRARKKVEIWSTETIFSKTIEAKINRKSGLRELLWEK